MRYQLANRRAGVKISPCVLVDGRAHDFAHLDELAEYASVMDALWDWERAEGVLDAVARRAGDGGVAVQDLDLAAPLLFPGQIYAAGSNYIDHRAEMASAMNLAARVTDKARGDLPWHFVKTGQGSVVGPGACVAKPAYSEKFDFEIELAVVIGRQARNVSREAALSHVAGYTIANDLTCRDAAKRPNLPDGSPFLWDYLTGKCFEGSCPMGPAITPVKFIGDPHDLAMKLWLNGELMQDARSSYMIFDIPEQIAALSTRLTLFPGDVILTGTPAGVGISRGVFLKPGDQLSLEIENIGRFDHAIA